MHYINPSSIPAVTPHSHTHRTDWKPEASRVLQTTSEEMNTVRYSPETNKVARQELTTKLTQLKAKAMVSALKEDPALRKEFWTAMGKDPYHSFGEKDFLINTMARPGDELVEDIRKGNCKGSDGKPTTIDTFNRVQANAVFSGLAIAKIDELCVREGVGAIGDNPAKSEADKKALAGAAVDELTHDLWRLHSCWSEDDPQGKTPTAGLPEASKKPIQQFTIRYSGPDWSNILDKQKLHSQ